MPAQCCKDFYNRIPDDVPVFTIVAWDKAAPDTVLRWIQRCQELGVNMNKIKRGLAHLNAIVNWQIEHPDRVKIPD